MEVSELVEAWGRCWEDMGLPRSDGRLLGYLLVCDPPEQSSADLRKTLGMSAGSVSMATRRLMALGLVERTSRPGSRSSYFRVVPGGWMRLMEGELGRIERLARLAQASERLCSDDRSVELRRLTEFWLEEWPKTLERIQRHLRP
ncbi:MAG: HTH-type transcriptional regulator MmpR5 [Acidimicrobiia bacterium]|nr:MAG: HTH-type transcriptional regulator MmpR5 [Acidimicrobiia bacterium]